MGDTKEDQISMIEKIQDIIEQNKAYEVELKENENVIE